MRTSNLACSISRSHFAWPGRRTKRGVKCHSSRFLTSAARQPIGTLHTLHGSLHNLHGLSLTRRSIYSNWYSPPRAMRLQCDAPTCMVLMSREHNQRGTAMFVPSPLLLPGCRAAYGALMPHFSVFLITQMSPRRPSRHPIIFREGASNPQDLLAHSWKNHGGLKSLSLTIPEVRKARLNHIIAPRAGAAGATADSRLPPRVLSSRHIQNSYD